MITITEHHRLWAARMTAATGTRYTPEYIAGSEQQAGKSYDRITVSEFRAMERLCRDGEPHSIVIDAIDRRPGAKNLEEVIRILDPDDPDYDEIVIVTRMMAPELLPLVKPRIVNLDD